MIRSEPAAVMISVSVQTLSPTAAPPPREAYNPSVFSRMIVKLKGSRVASGPGAAAYRRMGRTPA
jgi:hypothetical protein